MQLRHALIVKRDLSADQDIEDYTKTPYVHLGPGILFCLQQLRSSKVQTAAEGLELATGRKQVTQSKVNNLDVARFADEDVLNLQIAVDNAVPVAVIQGTGDLASELAGLFLLQTAV